eukprot:scaffold116147_cov17-Tisochrysis_lutea.AAC.3
MWDSAASSFDWPSAPVNCNLLPSPQWEELCRTCAHQRQLRATAAEAPSAWSCLWQKHCRADATGGWRVHNFWTSRPNVLNTYIFAILRLRAIDKYIWFQSEEAGGSRWFGVFQLFLGHFYRT